MATFLPLDTKATRARSSPRDQGYPESLAEILAVLAVQVDSRKNSSHLLRPGSHEKMVHGHSSSLSSIMMTRGGTHIHCTGNAVEACFGQTQDAVKAAIAVYETIENMNAGKDHLTRLHVKAGIDYGEIILNDHEIHGPAIDTARFLRDTASPDEIYISRTVYNLSRDLSSVHFELVHKWNKKNIPEEMEAYRVVWDAPVGERITPCPFLCFRPVWQSWDHGLGESWEDLLRVRRTLWEGQDDHEEILEDKSVVLILKRLESVVPLSLAVSSFLRKKLKNVGAGLIPIQIIADIGPYGNRWKSDPASFPPAWLQLKPGYLYMTEAAYNMLQQKGEIPGSPIHRSYGEQTFYQIAIDGENSSGGKNHFLYQKTLVDGPFEPCFYCGDRKHRPLQCPSKNIPESTDTINRLGYLSTDKLNNLFYRYVTGESQAGEREHTVQLLTEGSLGLAASGFFEVTRVFQLRFFRSFWNTTHEEWNRVRKSQNLSEGGLIWLAQDSLRVSELSKAESILASAMNKNPLDYRVHIASGFLHIEKNNLSQAEHYFSEAYTFAKTNVQRAFALLLLSRLCWVTGNPAKAYDKIQRIFSLNIESVDALYQDIVLKFHLGKERIACQRLSRLVQEDREFFVVASIDPDLADYSHYVGETLAVLLDRARKEAQSALSDAENEYALSAVALGQGDVDEIKLIRQQVDDLMAGDSYFGYLDTIARCNSIVTMCRNRTIHRKREIWEIFKELDKRLEANMSFVDAYPYRGMVREYRDQLISARQRIIRARSTGPALSQAQLKASHDLHHELSEEWDRLESGLRRLSVILKLSKASLRFLRWSGIFMAVVWFLDLFLFPLIIYYLNAVLSGFDVSTLPNVWGYQKNFLLFGSLLGLSVALFITIKNFSSK